ncbi:MAG: HAD family hydrolase, partial [Thermoanaerobaculia bacterium]
MVDVIAFDADDTLWHNERMFQATEAQFAELLSSYHPPAWVRERLFATEIKNLEHFGYGIKGFVLSMIETALDLTESRIGGVELRRIVDWGHEMLRHPVQLLDGVRETVEALSGHYRLMLLTKGDLFDQESKLARSGLGEFFGAVEIVSTKNATVYRTILTRHAIAPDRFVMVGNSLRS